MERPDWLKKKEDETGDGPTVGAKRNRRLVIELSLKLILLFMTVVALIYGLGAAFFGSSLIIPRNADAVLESVETPNQYRWVSESIRKLKIHDFKTEQGATRSAGLNISEDRYLASTWGILPQPAVFASDGVTTIQITPEDTITSADAQDGLLLNDACAAFGQPKTPEADDDQALPVKLVEMPSSEMLRAAEPTILNDKETFLGQRSWQIGFQATPEIIEQLLWIPFLDRARQGDSFASERAWIIGDEERQAIREGDYEILTDPDGNPWSYAWVTRDNRQLGQFDLKFRVDLGSGKSSEYRILAHTFLQNDMKRLEPPQLGGRDSLICD
jgi:hypothetical protein